jgi:hypothetical protein
MMRTIGLFFFSVLLGAGYGCVADVPEDDDGEPTSGSGASTTSSGPGAGLPADTSIDVLGGGTHDPVDVVITEIGTQVDGLNVPRDLAFNPQVAGQLWVVNVSDDSIVVYENAADAPIPHHFIGALGGEHFLANPAGLAFGVPGRFATIHDEDQPTQGEQTPADFMGPVLWTSELAAFDGGDESHYDMLHNSPLGMGIAWERDNIYWVFDGYHNAIVRYDFVQDHGPGGVNHEDGIITRYVEGQVKRVPGLAKQSPPSHMEFLPGTTHLYIADSGNGRIGKLDVATGSAGPPIGPNYDGCVMNSMAGATVETVVDGNAEIPLADGSGFLKMPVPSGLAIAKMDVGGVQLDVIFVTDNSNSTIFAWSTEGELLDYLQLDVPAGSLGGIAVGTAGDLWLTDAVANKVLRIESKAP